jgi:hypothetical protein
MLLAAWTGSVRSARSGRSRRQVSMSLAVDRPRSWLRSGSGAVTSSPIRVFAAAVLALTATFLATLSIRIASIGPVASLGAPLALPANTERAAASASIGSLLPRWRSSRRSGRGTSSTSTCCSWR